MESGNRLLGLLSFVVTCSRPVPCEIVAKSSCADKSLAKVKHASKLVNLIEKTFS